MSFHPLLRSKTTGWLEPRSEATVSQCPLVLQPDLVAWRPGSPEARDVRMSRSPPGKPSGESPPDGRDSKFKASGSEVYGVSGAGGLREVTAGREQGLC